MTWRIEQQNGLYLPDLGWHLDARHPSAKSFVSHAHFDHMGDHGVILCSRPTAALIQARLPGQRQWRVHDFGEPFELEPGIQACLYPAGHIVGSAMLHLRRGEQTFLYTGDFKLTPGPSAERCQPVKADTLVLETTYGLPRYVFPAEADVMADVARFCRETIENGETPVLYGYSLGKSQAILRALADSGLPVMLHPQSLKMTEACLALGWSFPPFSPFDSERLPGHVVVSPPLPKGASWLRQIPAPKTAIVSGWALDPGANFRYQCDKAFPLSDHADYLDLLSFVAQVAPKTVYTVHGFAQEFAATLRDLNYDAWALGRQNQLTLGIELPATEPTTPSAPPPSSVLRPPAPPESLAALAQLAAAIGATDSSKAKTELLATYLRSLPTPDAASAALFLTGRPFPRSSEIKLGLGWSQARNAALAAAGASETDFKLRYKTVRDSAEVLGELLGRRPVDSHRTIASLRSFLAALAAAPGIAFKHSFLAEEFRKLAPEEAKLLLTETTLPIATVALAVGFSSAAYFSTAFKRETGINPVEYRALR